MAATPTDAIQELCEEATCSLCLDYFTDPVTIQCGHNFCQGCITQCWQGLDQEVCCPQCRKPFQPKNLVPNWQLANFVEIITKKLGHLGEKGAPAKEVKGKVCEKHQEPLKLFCKDDQTGICVVCDRSLGHRNHEVVPVEEAAQQYKNQICIHLEFMKKEREKMLAYKAETEKESQDLIKQMKTEMEKTVANFRQLHQFLEEQEQHLLAKMELVVKEITKTRDEGWTRISKELSFVESLVQEMEEKCQQPQLQLLQDDRSIFLSKEKITFAYPMAFPPELKWEIWDSCEISSFLASVMKQFRDALISGQQWQKANIILDQDTAHPQLILSPDHKSVRLGEKCQKLPKKEERFDEKFIVLGRKGFTAGRHFWEVAVGNEEEWAVGVARKSVKRKGSIEFNPKGGIWEMGKWGGQYRAPNPSPDSFLRLGKEPKRIRVSLNSAAGKVAFYDADTAVAVYTFSAASFAGETLLPFFWVRQKGYLRVS